MKHRLFTSILVIVMLVLSAIPVTPAQALGGGYVRVVSIAVTTCNPNSFIGVRVNLTRMTPSGEESTRSHTLENLTRGGIRSSGTDNSTGSGNVINFSERLAPPGGTTTGDILKWTSTAFFIPSGERTVSSITFRCSTGQVIATSSGGLEGTQFFNPGDARMDPRPGDRIAVYCNQKNQVVVYGINDGESADRSGFLLAVFKVNDVRAAGDNGMTKNLGENGTVSISLMKGWYWVSWNGGKFGATGTDTFTKNFSETACNNG
jgi:hypothetical protein